MKTLIIAEAGVNHNGDLELARQLIDVAANAGADIIKFQTFSAARLVTQAAQKAVYQKQYTEKDESQYAMLSRLELTHAMHLELIAHCQKRNIQFLSTGFDIESIQLLVALGIDRFKIPSGEITNVPYLRYIGQCGKPVILSTGMSVLDEIEYALTVLEKSGMLRKDVIVLHCNTEYPTPMQDVNLRAMLTIRDQLNVTIGYSDHTLGIDVPIAAVALGASVIEKHITLDRTLPGPDHQASLEPHELKTMVTAIRNIEKALGDGVKRVTPSEENNRFVARKSLVANRLIRCGDYFTGENIAVKRPGNGVSPIEWDNVLGQKAKRDFMPDELLEL